MSADYKQLGLNLKKYRNEAGLTQEKLAELADVSLAHVNSIENVRGVPSVAVLFKIADVLKVTLDQLCYGSIQKIDGYLNKEFYRLTEGFDEKQSQCAANMAVSVWEQYRKYIK